jgi:hypothetical protein
MIRITDRTRGAIILSHKTDWLDPKGRTHRYLYTIGDRDFYRVGIPVESRVLVLPDMLNGADSSSYYAGTNDATIYATGAAYADAHDATTGTVSVASVNLVIGQNVVYAVYRFFLPFDTSDLPDTATVSAATLSLWGKTDVSTTDFDVTVVSYSGSNPAVGDDYDTFGTTTWGSFNTSTFSVGAYNTISLNATGLSNISKTGTTLLGLRSSKDISNTAPTGDEVVYFASADTADVTNDPKLDVTYSLKINVYVNIGGTWKQLGAISDHKVNVGGTWKALASIYVNVGGTWKTV